MDGKTYLCIDLKSFYASVECVDRNLDPLTTNLVVADSKRTEKTICLAVTPALKSYGISGRARLFEVVQKVRHINSERIKQAPGRRFTGESSDASELMSNPSLKLAYITAPPRMARYMELSTQIYDIYLKYVSSEDILVYSIDEVFMDITPYLGAMSLSARDFAAMIIHDVLETTGITATAGVGTNMYLAKVAMDIVAKKMPPNKDGARIAELDEMSYRRELWTHKPLTDFWRVGAGYFKKLEANHLYTMGDIAKASISTYGENLLYKLFGVNAELLIDHAWGHEPCTLQEAKAYKPASSSISSGQVLQCPYDFDKAKLIVREMTELLCLDLVEKHLVTDQIVLTVGYDIENLANPAISSTYKGEITTDYYGRRVPKHAHGTANIGRYTSSVSIIMNSVMELYCRIVDGRLSVRRINITANHIINEGIADSEPAYEQTDLFTDYDALDIKRREEKIRLAKERRIQETTIELRNRFGKNAVLKGSNLREGATTIERNNQIGGHRA